MKLPEKIEIFRNFAWKNRIFLPGSTTPPQISNRIDAAGWRHAGQFCSAAAARRVFVSAILESGIPASKASQQRAFCVLTSVC